MTNTELVERYPFLALHNSWTGEVIEDYDPERDGTYLDEMPVGWKIAFGEQMCEELRNELKKRKINIPKNSKKKDLQELLLNFNKII